MSQFSQLGSGRTVEPKESGVSAISDPGKKQGRLGRDVTGPGGTERKEQGRVYFADSCIHSFIHLSMFTWLSK